MDDIRRRVLAALSSDQSAIDEIFSYCANPFHPEQLPPAPVLPLLSEPHIADWKRYLKDGGSNPFADLQRYIGQLNIPIREGVSETEAYADVARRGKPFRADDFGGQLQLAQPERFSCTMYYHDAGILPVLATPHRADFEVLYRALGCRSEPRAIPPSVNAQMVAGFNNWDRVHRYRDAWRAGNPNGDWGQEIQRVVQDTPELFRDRFIVVGDAPYSSLTAAALGLGMNEDEWVAQSKVIRLEHEFTHYATKRLFNTMRNNLLDETIADFMGLTAARGNYRASLFLHFLGLEQYPGIRDSGRIFAYRGDLSPGAFSLLCKLTVESSRGLEELYRACYTAENRQQFFLALTRMTLELLAAPARSSLFSDALQHVAGWLPPPAA